MDSNHRRNRDHRRNQGGPGARKPEPKTPVKEESENSSIQAEKIDTNKPIHAFLITQTKDGKLNVTALPEAVEVPEGMTYQPSTYIMERIIGDVHRELQTHNVAEAAARLMAERMGGKR
jgi:hypothetical protein